MLLRTLRLNGFNLLLVLVATLHLGTADFRAQSDTTHALGEYSLLFVSTEFADDADPPVSAAKAQGMVARANQELRSYSYDAFWLDPTVAHIRLPQPRSFYDQFSIYAAVRQATRDAGHDSGQYQIVCYQSTFFGTSHALSKEVFLGSTNIATLIHEIGHALGLPHANSVAFPSNDFLGEGTPEDYGHVYDMMGYATHYLQPENPSQIPWGHFNAFLKYRLGWLPEDNVATVSANGIYSLASIDFGGLTPARPHALRIPRTSTEDFWIELRTGAPDSFNGNGVLIMLCDSSPFSLQNLLIDTTPGTEPVWKFNGRGGTYSGNFDAALTAGRSLTDPKTGILIAPLGWKNDRFDVFVRLSGTEPPPSPYHDGLFTWVYPDFFPAGFEPQLIFGYHGYFSPVPGKSFTIEDSADLKTWHHVTNFLSDGSVIHFNRELSTFAPRFFRARPGQ